LGPHLQNHKKGGGKVGIFVSPNTAKTHHALNSRIKKPSHATPVPKPEVVLTGGKNLILKAFGRELSKEKERKKGGWETTVREQGVYFHGRTGEKKV